MRVSSRWHIHYINPEAKKDEISMTSGQPGMVIIDATSKTSALKQARKYLKRGVVITAVMSADNEGVLHVQ
jgi:hypothetical protein